MKTLLAVITGLIVTNTCFAEKPIGLLHGKHKVVKTEFGSVTWQLIADDQIQREVGGSGGSVYKITVDNTEANEPYNGTQISFICVATEAAILSYENGMPVFEFWGGGGAGVFGCGLNKFKNGRYQRVSGKVYTTIRPNPDAKPVRYLPSDTNETHPLFLKSD